MTAVNLAGQLDMPLQIAHKDPEIAQGSKTDLGRRLALLLRKYDDRPSSGLWIEIQETAKEVLK